ncbi:hypothetical protein B0O99DRAFT_226815 [Bisporella sp. PMI_857]|nr:hypothetical protein B0O99DRAFT_226815 [Bisporella sp. PMI_857]
MVSSIFKAASALALLSTASAAPTTRQVPNYPPTSLSSNFRLVANVTGADLSTPINDYVLTSYHTGAGTGYAVLVPATTPTEGRIFYVNGTAEEVRYNNANLLSDSGVQLFPSGVSINADSTISINAGAGQAGVGLKRFPVPVPELAYLGNGEFYACVKDLVFGPAVQLFYKSGTDVATPAGCADVSLLPQCSEGSGAEDEFANTVNCYADVAGIDWSVYSAA